MADIALAPAPVATPLTAWLAAADPNTHTAAYRGVITPVSFDAPATETAALFRGAAVHDLGWLRRIRVLGADRFRWLSGMISNTVTDLQAQSGAYNLVLNAQGRIQGDLTVWRATSSNDSLTAVPGSADDTLELEIAADQVDKLLSHLDRFIIMDDVELSFREGETCLGLTGPEGTAVLTRLGLPRLEPMTHTRIQWNGMGLRIRRGHGVRTDHFEIWTQSALVSKLWKFLITGGALPVGFQAVESLRVVEGIPAYGIDIAERDLPQETSLTDRALHFNKGCYLGQEIVERIRSRGAVHRHLRQVEFDGPRPAPGIELILSGAAVGHVTSSAEVDLGAGLRRFGIAMVKAEAEVRDLPLQYESGEGQGEARLLPAPPTF